MKAIFKYNLPVKLAVLSPEKIEIQKGAIFLKAKNQREELSLWFEVDPEETEVEDVHFFIVHTGDYLPDNKKKYLETVLFDDGSYVVHLYRLL